ncbi:hypothetical protein [Bradyrhizobium macuxiense]|uniref:hypothetical protein n=1 Tax=Bradyrhizobium macuxiense TaxID=1755647 RepID=UPI000B104694|nr:hypothetical protein [Bradyrhizobium macuxiense]
MFPSLKFGRAMPVLVGVALSLVPNFASAITAEVARKCHTLTAAQFPPRLPGNPAAGSAKGSGREQTDFYNKCVANGGKPDDSAAPPNSATPAK